MRFSFRVPGSVSTLECRVSIFDFFFPRFGFNFRFRVSDQDSDRSVSRFDFSFRFHAFRFPVSLFRFEVRFRNSLNSSFDSESEFPVRVSDSTFGFAFQADRLGNKCLRNEDAVKGGGGTKNHPRRPRRSKYGATS